MPVKNFEDNWKKISENIVKLKLKQNVKPLLYNHLAYICAEKTDFCQLYDKSTREDWEPTLMQFTVKVIIESVWNNVFLIWIT